MLCHGGTDCWADESRGGDYGGTKSRLSAGMDRSYEQCQECGGGDCIASNDICVKM